MLVLRNLLQMPSPLVISAISGDFPSSHSIRTISSVRLQVNPISRFLRIVGDASGSRSENLCKTLSKPCESNDCDSYHALFLCDYFLAKHLAKPLNRWKFSLTTSASGNSERRPLISDCELPSAKLCRHMKYFRDLHRQCPMLFVFDYLSCGSPKKSKLD